MHKKNRIAASAILILSTTGVVAQTARADTPDNQSALGSDEWFVLGGGGESHPGWGKTKEKVRTLDVILRRKRAQAPIQQAGDLRYQRSMLIEVPFSELHTPKDSPMIGLTINACWTLIREDGIEPYVFVGGGPAYTHAEIPGTSSKLKGTYQAGIGVEFKGHSVKYLMEFRFHHVSNGGIKKPNDPLNSSKFLFGIEL